MEEDEKAEEETETGMGELRDTEYILKASVKRLQTDRKRLISAEMEAYVQGQEAKLIKLFARVLHILGAQGEAGGRKSETSLELWLSVVNVSPVAAGALVPLLPKGLPQLLNLSPEQLDELRKEAGLSGEDARRFTDATSHLAAYWRRWEALGREPEREPEFSNSRLAWISYARPSFADSADAEARRSVSESGMDSGASDSGLGSNVSQNSLPTTTPPPSPMWAAANSASLSIGVKHPQSIDWSTLSAVGNAARSSRGLTPPHQQPASPALPTPRTSTKSSSSTPPPSLKWGTGLKAETSSPIPHPTDEVALIPRSHSHESNLQHRIHRPAQAQPEMATARLLSTGAGKAGGSSHLAKPATLRMDGRRRSGEHLVLSPDDLSPASPGPGPAASLRSRTPSVSSQTKTPDATAPRSPRTGGRIFHAIPHNFRRKILNPSKPCIVCKKNMGLKGGERCKSCRLVVHTECKRHISEDTCGLTPQHVKSIIGLLVEPPPMGSGGVAGASGGLGGGGDAGGGGVLSPELAEGTDSSSCNSSQPSTPAPTSTLPSPYPYSQPPRKFTFPDLPEAPEVPNIRIDEASSLVDTRSSDNSTIQGSVTGLSSQGSQGSVPGSVAGTFAAEDAEAKSLARDASLHGQGWREVTIELSDIHFAPNSKLRRGIFGETHRGYHHQDVAVKFLDMDHVTPSDRLAAFKAEVGVAKHTRHENVVLFMGYCLEPAKLGIVLNFCHGLSLHSLLHEKRERPELPRIVTMATQVAQGMSYLHGKSILHKDLRGKNVFVQPKGKVVISDFGLFSLRRLFAAQARLADGSHLSEGKQRAYLRVPDHWLCYQSPSLLRALQLPPLLPLSPAETDSLPALPFTEASDLFAFGSLWFELLSGEFPWKEMPNHSLIWQVCSGLRPPLQALPPVKELKELLLQCWSGKASFTDVLGALDRLPKKAGARQLTRSPSHPVSLAARSAESLF